VDCIIILLSCPSYADDRYSIITVKNETPNFKLVPTIEIFGSGTYTFSENRESGAFEYRFKLSETGWFNKADIKLLWKDAYINNDGSKTDFPQRVELRLRYSFPPSFPIRAYFNNDRSQSEMFRLEHLSDDNDQWDKFFRGWQIAAYYRATNGLQHPLSQRATTIFFDAADRLAANIEDYIVVMSPDAITFASEAFKMTPGLAKRINNAKSVYWEDLPRLYDLANNNCTAARILERDLRKAKSKEPELLKLRGGMRWPRLSEQIFRIDKWSVCRG
jgi:hypothetical protein